MPYTALYRKKRPQTFHEIIGQPAVVRALLNQLNSGQTSHAYLFCGTRGTGKTSVARIFTRAVNCEHPQNGEPCNVCESCQNILSERSLSVAEIDAASNNGVENIRDLRDEVKYPPTDGRYKIYIIDEVHMLSTSAFNALLKTLEEPPAHAKFLLATTDPQKVPATILSRCQRYDFKRITPGDMVNAMRGYLDADGVENVTDGALEVIAAQSDGAMRDALSILDQALSLYAGEKLDATKVYECVGAADKRVLDDFAYALAVSDVNRVFEIIDAASRDGRDMAQFAVDLIQRFRDMLVRSAAKSETVQAEQSHGEEYKINPEQLIHWLLVFSEALRDLRYAPNPRTALEVVALRLCAGGGEKENSQEALLARIARLEARLEYLEENGVTVGSNSDKSPAEKPPTDNAALNKASAESAAPDKSLADKSIAENSAAAAPAEPEPASASPYALDPALFKKVKTGWPSFCAEFPAMMRSMLTACSVSQQGASLVISGDVESAIDYLKPKKKILTEKLIMMFNLPATVNLAFNVADVYNKITKTKQDTASPVKTPVQAVQKAPETGPADENPPTWESAPAWDDDWAGFGEQVDMPESEGVW